MFMVYWTELVSGSDKMKNTLGKCEEMRNRKYAGESVNFIAMSSEDPNCVRKMELMLQGHSMTGRSAGNDSNC